MNNTEDVPSPIDLKNLQDALQWEQEANIKRPSRTQFFQFYADELVNPISDHYRVLEIASGPGFLAEVLLHRHPRLDYTALDFSEAMHYLAQQRLSCFNCNTIQFILADFKQPYWYSALDAQKYDVIIIHQALHELRHKNYAKDFHRIIATHLLKENGCYAVCDHLVHPDGKMQNNELYMSRQEHLDAFAQSGFHQIRQALFLEGLQLFLTHQ